MKKRNKFYYVTTLLAIPFLLTGCFFTKADNTDDNISSDSFVLDPNENYKIEFMMWGANDEIRNYSALVDSFMDEYPNITVSISTQDSTQYMATLTGRLSGTMPDLFYLPEYEFRTWADSGRLLSISNGITEEEYSKLWPGSIDWYSYNRDTKKLGKSEGSNLYCLPKDIGPWTLMYNVDMIEEMVTNNKLSREDADLLADSKHALTWKKFVEICIKIQNYYGVEKDNSNFFAVPYYEISSAIWSNNADYFDEGAMHSKVNSDEFVESIEWLWDLIYTNKIIPKSTGDTAQNMFLAKNSAFCWVGPYLTPMYKQQGMNYRLIPVPYNGDNAQAKSTTWIGSLGLAISKQTKNAAAALALMKYLSINDDAQKDFVKRGQLMPNIKSLALSDEFLGESEISNIWPANRDVYCDIVDEFNGETLQKEGVSQEDLIGGRIRPHYYTFENSWLNAIETEIADIFALKNRSEIRTRLNEFNPVLQGYLDQSNKSGGII